jgi:hypothetical protein
MERGIYCAKPIYHKTIDFLPEGELPVVYRLHIVVERSISGLAAKNLNRKNHISRWILAFGRKQQLFNCD